MAKTPAVKRQHNLKSGPSRPWLQLTIITLLLVMTIGSAIYAMMLMGEIRRMRENTDVQRQMLAEQMELTRQGLELTRQMLESVNVTEDIAKQQLDISSRLLGLAEQQDINFDRSLTIQQQMLAVARATLSETREINRRFQAPPSAQSFVSTEN